MRAAQGRLLEVRWCMAWFKGHRLGIGAFSCASAGPGEGWENGHASAQGSKLCGVLPKHCHSDQPTELCCVLSNTQRAQRSIARFGGTFFGYTERELHMSEAAGLEPYLRPSGCASQTLPAEAELTRATASDTIFCPKIPTLTVMLRPSLARSPFRHLWLSQVEFTNTKHTTN